MMNSRGTMKIYTKTGDTGKTHLLGGARVEKCDPRVDCYGLVDELNASIGWAAAGGRLSGDAPAGGKNAGQSIVPLLPPVQNDLFVIGSHLAVPDGAQVPASVPPLNESMIRRLENEIDQAEAQLLPLRNFILPGGGELASRLHLARTICRRAERQIVRIAREQSIPPTAIVYLNRLSDWLFVHARLANRQAGIEDIPWRGNR
jgi:cob(I)alamin adenosyltransferase